MRRQNLNWKEVEATAVEALLSTGFFERVYTHDDLKSGARRRPIRISSCSRKRFTRLAALT